MKLKLKKDGSLWDTLRIFGRRRNQICLDLCFITFECSNLRPLPKPTMVTAYRNYLCVWISASEWLRLTGTICVFGFKWTSACRTDVFNLSNLWRSVGGHDVNIMWLHACSSRIVIRLWGLYLLHVCCEICAVHFLQGSIAMQPWMASTTNVSK